MVNIQSVNYSTKVEPKIKVSMFELSHPSILYIQEIIGIINDVIE